MIFKNYLPFFLVLADLSQIAAQVFASIEFRAFGVPIVSLTKAEVADAQTDPDFIAFRDNPNLTVACTVGIWRFYPELNFDYTTEPGFQIGIERAQQTCFNISSHKDELGQMMSFRALGRVQTGIYPSTVHLDERSITVYTKPYGSGLGYSFTEGELVQPLEYTAYAAQSFFITSAHSIVLPNFAPVFKIFWEVPTANPPGKSLCIFLNQTDSAGGLTKMYFNQDMIFDGFPIELKGLEYRHADSTDIDAFCPDQIVGVRSNNFTIFKEVTYPFE